MIPKEITNTVVHVAAISTSFNVSFYLQCPEANFQTYAYFSKFVSVCWVHRITMPYVHNRKCLLPDVRALVFVCAQSTKKTHPVLLCKSIGRGNQQQEKKKQSIQYIEHDSHYSLELCSQTCNSSFVCNRQEIRFQFQPPKMCIIYETKQHTKNNLMGEISDDFQHNYCSE